MAEPNPHADSPHECLGVDPDASVTEIKIAAAKAKSDFNPDHYPDGEKRPAREKLYRVRAAEEAIVGDGTYPPPESELTAATEGRESDNGSSSADTSEVGGHDGRPSATPSLSVSVDAEVVTRNDPVTVTVTADGSPASDGHVEASTGESAPLSDGEARLSFDTLGEVRIEATVPQRGVEPAATTVEVLSTDQLSIEPHRDRVLAGETVTFDVRDASGNRLREGTVTADGETAAVERGRASLTFETRGEQTVTARAPGRTADTTTVEVVPPETRLCVDPVVQSVTPGEAVSVSVRRQRDGQLVEGATVETDRGHEATAERGRATLSFEYPGTVSVVARKEDTATSYQSDETTVRVVQTTVDLALDVPPETTVGEKVHTEVRDQFSDPVPNVQVTVVDEEGGIVSTRATDERGETRLSFDVPGEYTVRAERGADSGEGPATTVDDDQTVTYVPHERTVRVEPESAMLVVSVRSQPTTPGDRGRFVVRDEWGRRLSGVTLATGDRETETDERGRATLEFPTAGEHTVSVEADGPFEPTTLTVSVGGGPS